MRMKICGLCLALLFALPTSSSQAAEPGQGGLNAFPEAPAGPNAQSAQAADKPSTLETLTRTLKAQGEVSQQTMDALKGSPGAMDAIGKGDKAPAPSAPAQGGKKAIYGDIIIHK